MSYMYRYCIPSNLEETRNLVSEILKELNKLIKDENLLFDLRIILNELVINSVIHGNKCDDSKKVMIDLEVRNSKICIQVVDEGLGIDYNFDIYNPDNLESYGRGLIIVRGLTDELYIEKNKVQAVKYI